jgi:hypothetical protein
MLAGQQAYRQYCRREKEIQRQFPVAEKPPQSPGVTAANFSAKFFAKFSGESWVGVHGTGFLGGAPFGPPPPASACPWRLDHLPRSRPRTWSLRCRAPHAKHHRRPRDHQEHRRPDAGDAFYAGAGQRNPTDLPSILNSLRH